MSEAAPPFRRINFPEAGEGVYLLLRNRHFREFFNVWGPRYFQVIEQGLLGCDTEVMDKLLTLATHRDTPKGTEALELTLDSLDHLTLEVVQTRLLDAFTMAANGRTYEEHIKWLSEQAKDSQSPLTSPVDFSAGSTEPPAGPGSA